MNFEVICPQCGYVDTWIADELCWDDNATIIDCEGCGVGLSILMSFKTEILGIVKLPNKLYEWMYKVDNEMHWHICSRLLKEKDAVEWFTAENIMKDKKSKIQYKKTGRSFKEEDFEHTYS